MDFNLPYDRNSYVRFFRSQFLPEDFEDTSEAIALTFSPQYTKKVTKIGQSNSLDLNVYEIQHTSENDPRVSLSKESFRLLAEYGQKRALVLFTSKPSPNYRLSLVTIDLKWEEGKRPTREYSNPRRYSFFLGPDAKIHTPEQYLVAKGRVKDFDDLKNRFSIEVVNKDFYTKIAILFTKLTGGKRKARSQKFDEKGSLVFPSPDDTKKKEFAVRLIGRLVFCWFLKKKYSKQGVPLLPEEVLSSKVVRNCKGLGGYYHSILEPLFFEVLNTPMDEHRKQYQAKPWTLIPFLNGGLFTPHDDDYYGNNEQQKAQLLNTLKVPNKWLCDLIEIFETYNFTIDENTPIDVELSIEPEMLGRIFENLLAEINPETGETARKATGSYYTPRPIVEYMVDESLKQYLLAKTSVSESKIASLLSYTDEEPGLTESQKDEVLDALDAIKIVDPACGSGAFPMGILQKILLILRKIDPDSKKWLEKILAKINDPMVRREFEKKLGREALEYVHKLGIIRDAIYGADIQPIAVEISKLRCFLSLIVDETVDDAQPNRGIEPLPNLEFKFVCANSLIGLDSSRLTTQKAMELKDRLKKLRADYLVSYGNEKTRAEKEFRQIQSAMAKLSLDWGEGSVETLKLADWKPFEEKPCGWFDPEWMFGVKDGFDIVIGNPPYLEARSPQFSTEMKEGFKEAFMQRWPGNPPLPKGSDLLVYFIELSVSIVNKAGHTVLITQNSWLDTEYGKKLQNFLLRNTEVKAIIDSDYKYFESKSGPNINTVILIFRGKALSPAAVVRFIRCHDTFERQAFSLSGLQQTVESKNLDCHVYHYGDKNLESIKWGILLASETCVLELLDVLREKGRPYDEIDENSIAIGQGLNLSTEYFVDGSLISKFRFLEEAAIPIMTNLDGALYDLSSTARFLVNRNELSPKEIDVLAKNGVKTFDPNSTSKERPMLILPRGVSRHFCAVNSVCAFSSSYVDIYNNSFKRNESIMWNLWLFFNSSILWLLREISGRKNLGGGLLKAEAVDLRTLAVYFDFNKTNEIKKIFSVIRKREVLKTLEEVESQEHKEIDSLVFDYLKIKSHDRERIIQFLKNTIASRAAKSKT